MKLFESFTLKNMTLKNRLVMPPMCMYSAEPGTGLVNDFHLSHYTARAIGGAGLVIVEATGVTPEGRIGRCHVRDASWLQWPLLEAVIENNIVADFPLCNKSFNCSYSGHDL